MKKKIKINSYEKRSLPALVESFAKLLRENIKEVKKVDTTAENKKSISSIIEEIAFMIRKETQSKSKNLKKKRWA